MECNLDNGDCGFCYNSNSAYSCDIDKLLNDTCDVECMSIYCDFDKDACGGDYCNTEQTCLTSMINNNVCDLDCVNHEECKFDG